MNRTLRNIILKARQLGMTTAEAISDLDDALFMPNITCVLLAHKVGEVQKMFRKVKTAYDNMPEYIEVDGEMQRLKPQAKYDNKNELFFADHNSSIAVAIETRGDTVQRLHFSEAAYTKDFEDKLAGSSESVPMDGRILIESTANGLGGYFYTLWTQAMNGESAYKPFFYAWTWDEDYQMEVEQGFEFTGEHEEYMIRHSITREQMRWRLWKISSIGEKKFKEAYPITPEEAFIASGGNRFNIERLIELAAKVNAPIEKREHITIWKKPEKGKVYVMGTDASKGKQTGDFQTTDVLDYLTGEQVAQIRCRIAIERFTELSTALGKEYNNALWGIELQDHGFTMLSIAKREYTNLFARRNPSSKGTDDKEAKEFGWSTNAKTKPIMIDELDFATNSGEITLNSRVTISEMMTYLEDVDGTTNAAEGEHDDTVISAAIAWQMRKYVRTGPVVAKKKPKGL